jgi:hypothetical protein
MDAVSVFFGPPFFLRVTVLELKVKFYLEGYFRKLKA